MAYKPMPQWLKDHLYAPITGTLTYRYGRIAKVCLCQDCNVRVLQGLADEIEPAKVEIVELTEFGEVGALLDGRATYRLYGHLRSTLELSRRDTWRISTAPIGTSDANGKIRVFAEHKCGKPIPREWIAG